MMTPDGGPAFPVLQDLKTHDNAAPHTKMYHATSTSGLSLRDYFAAHLGAGCIAHGGLAAAIAGDAKGDTQKGIEVFAAGCYELADALLKERAR